MNAKRTGKQPGLGAGSRGATSGSLQEESSDTGGEQRSDDSGGGGRGGARGGGHRGHLERVDIAAVVAGHAGTVLCSADEGDLLVLVESGGVLGARAQVLEQKHLVLDVRWPDVLVVLVHLGHGDERRVDGSAVTVGLRGGGQGVLVIVCEQHANEQARKQNCQSPDD